MRASTNPIKWRAGERMVNEEVKNSDANAPRKYRVRIIKELPNFLPSNKIGDIVEMSPGNYNTNKLYGLVEIDVPNIPQYKNNPDLRFCKLRNKTKKPFEQSWTEKLYTYDEVTEHRMTQTNFGVLCGPGGLAVLDCDKEDLYIAAKKDLPPTFEVKTGSGGKHLYFIIPELKKKIILQTDEKNHYGEVQSNGTQVVGAGSIHPNGKIYEVINDVPIAKITLEELMVCIKPFMKPAGEDIAINENRVFFDSDDPFGSVSITSVINTAGFKRHGNGELYGSNPWHGSATGQNLWINSSKNVAHCFRCDAGISVAKAIALNEGICKNCGDSLKGEPFKRLLEIATSKYGYKPPERFKVLHMIKEANESFIKDEKGNILPLGAAYSKKSVEKPIAVPLAVNATATDDTTTNSVAITWDDLQTIDKFILFQGKDLECIYEVHFQGQIISLNGEELMQPDKFKLKFFNTFGVMLPTGRNFKNYWASLLTHWRGSFGEIRQKEDLSDSEEAREIIIDYINNCSIVDKHTVKEGVVTVKDGFVFVPTKIIRKIMRRNNLEKIAMRKLAYILQDYLATGSIPLKIDNKSERFWKFKADELDIDMKRKLELNSEEDEKLLKEEQQHRPEGI